MESTNVSDAPEALGQFRSRDQFAWPLDQGRQQAERQILKRHADAVAPELPGFRVDGVRTERHAIGQHDAWTARTIDSTDRSTSASVVDQFDTEMRIASMSCQRVPPNQHTRSSCTRRIVVTRRAIGVAGAWLDTHEHLIEHDLVEDSRAAAPSATDPQSAPPAGSSGRSSPRRRCVPVPATPRTRRSRAPGGTIQASSPSARGAPRNSARGRRR